MMSLLAKLSHSSCATHVHVDVDFSLGNLAASTAKNKAKVTKRKDARILFDKTCLNSQGTRANESQDTNLRVQITLCLFVKFFVVM